MYLMNKNIMVIAWIPWMMVLKIFFEQQMAWLKAMRYCWPGRRYPYLFLLDLADLLNSKQQLIMAYPRK